MAEKKVLFAIVLMLTLALGTSANAATVWDPASNGIYPPAVGNWNVGANWTAGVPASADKAQFFKTNAAECQVTDAQTFGQLVQGDNGAADAGVIRVMSGGNLTTTAGYSAIGYNKLAKMIVETGGAVSFASHLWVGNNLGGIGTLELAGGTVSGAGNFSLGWNGGIGYADIKDGVLNLNSWAGIDAIKGSSHMDIEAGSVIVVGDRTGEIASFITAGKLTAYGGTGVVVYDYGVTNLDKTTIRAVEGSEGDLDGDNDVDFDDLLLFVQDWAGDLPIDGAVAYWMLDESTGAVAADDSANGYDGTLIDMDDSDWVDGLSGNALDFDGVNDHVVAGGVCTGIAGGDVTVSAWVKAPVVNTAHQFVVSINTSNGTNNRLMLGTQANSATLSLYESAWHDTATTVIDGTWHHVAYVLEDGLDTITIYVDGSDVLSFASTASIAATDVFSLGQEYDTGLATGDFYSGLLDDVRVYDRALSAPEIARLDADCDYGGNIVGDCLVDGHDYAVLASNWMQGYVTNWHVADTVYPTDDIIVTPHYANNLGIVADGTTDVTDAIQDALISVSNLGGGALFLPAGNYKVSGNLTIPAKVTLRGDWQKPVPGSPIVGTILQAYAGRGDENAAPFIELSGSSGINGITIWYPEQLPTSSTDLAACPAYPPTIHGGGATVENVTFVNSYIGFTTFVEGTTARPFTRGVYGTPLRTGIEYDRLADIGRMETVHFSPDFWRYSGLANAPTAGEHEAWIYNNGRGIIVRRIDWSYSCYVTVEGYSMGLVLGRSRWSDADEGDPPKYRTPNGQSYGFNLIDCKYGVYIAYSAYAGYQFTRFDIQGAETGVYLGVNASETDMFNNCTINASGDAILSEGTAKVMMMSCDIQQGTVDINGGYLSAINSNFTSTTTNHIELAVGVHGASILGNTFAGGANISDSTPFPVNIDHTPLAVDAMPAYDYKKPETGFKAAKDDLFVVTKSPYNAQADGVADDTSAFQAALADADANGGGIVFVPGGTYRLDGNLTIPTGVELKGVFDIPHGTSDKGSLLNVYAGRNNAGGTPFIQIESGAGIRGLSFHYPEQIYNRDEDDPVTGMYGMVPYPFLIRGLGSDVYVINIAATIPYQLLDLATNRCDDHYIDYIFSTALKTGIHVGNGSEDGQIQNCQFNPSAYTHQSNYYDSIPTGGFGDDSVPDPINNIHKIQWRDATPYLFGNMTGEVLHENFVFGGAWGMRLVEEGGFGPSGYCMGMGVDACTTAFHIDDIGSGGLEPINSQIVSTDKLEGHYLETGASLTDTFRMFGSAGWGGHLYSVVINGGDVRLQLFHLARDGEAGAFQVFNTASLQSFGGTVDDYLSTPFLTIIPDSTATAEFVGNVINTSSTNMPGYNPPSNVTAIGNLRIQ